MLRQNLVRLHFMLMGSIFVLPFLAKADLPVTISSDLEEDEDLLWAREKERIKNKVSAYTGWCTVNKADLILEVLRTQRPSLVVDIGSYGGSTFSVMVQTLQYNQQGVAVAIDPWQVKGKGKEFPSGSPADEFWNRVDFSKIYQGLIKNLTQDGLINRCKIYQNRSCEVVHLFEDNSIDFLHIDGDHSDSGFLFDAYYFYPKVRENGYILLNDANWFSARRALTYLLETCELCTPYSESAPFLLFKKTMAVKRIADQLWR